MLASDSIRHALSHAREGLAWRAARLRELAQSPALDLTITAWVDSRQILDEIKALKAEADALLSDFADELVPAQLDRHGLTGAPHVLGSVKLTHHTKCSIVDGRKPDAFCWLHHHNLGGIIIETVPAKTLQKTAKERIEQGQDMPPDLFNVQLRRYAALTLHKDTFYGTQEE